MTAQRHTELLDTYLLNVFCLLLAERNVSRVALKLNQSQPTISVALRRLRGILGDPLLVREKSGMVPTERALKLLPHARAALAQIDSMLSQPDTFDPATTRQPFRIGSPDYLAPIYMSSVCARVRREAPDAQVTVHALGPDFDFERSLAEGDLDVVIGNWPAPPDRMHMSILLEDEIVCLVAADHPLAAGGMTLADYRQAVHVVPLPYSMTQRGVIDGVLASERLERDERLVVQSFNLAPYVLPGTDLVFTTSRHFAAFYAKLLPLAIVPAPLPFPSMRFYQLWHERNHQSQAHRWLRRLLGDCGRELSQIRPPA